ncbi:hypothetical protein RRG08_018029 [Elysia crispata]|uniref:Uncharacterized protein n=1 Tax=Elysia crispata TaxID=231223 RepID=A0AAE1DF53_9GAST|nr:hypothetical protein RRG08_018029 [Elysia crispata]
MTLIRLAGRNQSSTGIYSTSGDGRSDVHVTPLGDTVHGRRQEPCSQDVQRKLSVSAKFIRPFLYRALDS